jgi:transposase
VITREQFQHIYDQGPDAVYELILAMQRQIDELTARVKELEDRLNKNSRNSNLPPSSDTFTKKPVSLRKKSGRRPGGQKGHPGRTLEFVDDPNRTIVHTPGRCAHCGASLRVAPIVDATRRQVWELPELCMMVTEHRAHTLACPHCRKLTSACFPAGVDGPVSYGPGVGALACYLSHFQLLPFGRVAALMNDVFGASICQGSIARITKKAHHRLADIEAHIYQAIKESRLAHFDETGVRIGAKLFWQHVASTKKLTFYSYHEKRGRAAIEKIGILSGFSGRAVHDGWPSYSAYACSHALCNAHHLRELTGLYETGEQPWTLQMKELLLSIKKAVDRAKAKGKKQLSAWRTGIFEARYDRIVKAGYCANPPPQPTGERGRPKQGPARSLLLRLDTKRDSVLAFMYDFSVPFDNNLAERDLRMQKLKQKISGCFRSRQGAAAFCRIRGYISTMRKQGHNVLDVLESLFAGEPITPAYT